MKTIPLILWTLLCVSTALLLICAIFVHSSVITFVLAAAAFMLAYIWWHDEIKSIINND